MIEEVETCECSEHVCIPVPGQTERYRVNTGPFNQGVVKLCPHCYVNGHEWLREHQFRLKRDQYQARLRAEEAANG